MIGQEEYRRALATVREWKRAWIVPHARADGDAIGALIGARHILRQFGTEVSAIVFEPVTPRYEFLVAEDPLTVWNESLAAQAGGIDGLLIVDTCARTQLEPLAGILDRLEAPVVVFDHHKTRDVKATLSVIDEGAAAASLMIFEWAEANLIELSDAANLALFAGLASDTGWFRFENADRRAFETAGRLIEGGVRPDELYNRLFCSDRPERIALLGRVLESIELHAGGKVAVAHYTRETIKACGAGPGDFEGLVTEIGMIGSVVCWALLSKHDEGPVRINLRSKHSVDVAAIAENFGGGGHSRAAGARTNDSLPTAIGKVVQLLVSSVE